MMAWLQRRPLSAALALLVMILLLFIGLETGFGSRLHTAEPGRASKAAAPDAKLLPPVVAVAPEQAYPETGSRPLFVPTRRPAPVEVAAGKPAFVRGQFVLQGVIALGDQRTALLREKSSGRIHRVETGKDVNGIKVEKIEPTEVVLAMSGERETVALTVQRPGGPAGSGTATPGDPGPFGVPAAQPLGIPAAVPSGAPGTEAPPVQGRAPPGSISPAARGPTNTGAAAAGQPATQPMSPEELLARRRARRNQPTQ